MPKIQKKIEETQVKELDALKEKNSQKEKERT